MFTKSNQTIAKFTVFLATAMFAGSCSDNKPIADSNGGEIREYRAVFDENRTRTSLGTDGAILWNQGDTVQYFSRDNGTVSKFIITEDGATATIRASVGTSDTYIVASYGGSAITDNTSEGFTICDAVDSRQSGLFSDAHVSVATANVSGDATLSFKNVTSLVKFTFERDDISYITFTAADGTAINDGGTTSIAIDDGQPTASFSSLGSPSTTVDIGGSGTFYMSTVPCTIEGFTIDCFDSEGSSLGKITTTKSLVLAQNTIANLGTLDQRISSCSDLSAEGCANCYIVPAPGKYRFLATVKGSSSEAIDDTPHSAETIWESFGDETAPSDGDIVKDISFSGGYIYFTGVSDGNALIALKDASGSILWSWHIWVCNGFDPTETAQTYSCGAGTLMDRNLGATSATPGDVHSLGLLYQWGRKDPFLSGRKIWRDSNTSAESTITWPSAVTSSAETGTIEYVTKHPTTFICTPESQSDSNNNDWYYTGTTDTDNTRWNPSKGIYDPCPYGWRVPDGGKSGVWYLPTQASTGGLTYFDSSMDSSNRGIDFGSSATHPFTNSVTQCWYPCAGDIFCATGKRQEIGSAGFYHSCTPSTADVTNEKLFMSHRLYFTVLQVTTSGAYYRAYGGSVRCCKQ